MPILNRSYVVACVLSSTLLFATFANSASADMDPTPLLQEALRFRVTIHTNRRTGYMVAAAHCRRASEGCDRRLFEFAHYLKDAGDRNGIDPWMLAAMAFRESGLNPFAIGGVGELGILQLHPKSKYSQDVRFVKDGWYRIRCHHQAGACQREIVDRAAELLARSIAKCNGDVDQALGMYNTGHCGGHPEYARRIRREVARMKSAV
ncbi:MAG TPA: transglycosylase SLT domain-containing protein, partial [Polyangiales bacterium]